MPKHKISFWKLIKEYGIMILGLLFYTTGWTVFLMPNNLISGGVTGISSIIQYATGGVIKAGMQVLGESGRPVPALLPVEIRVYDSSGRELDGAGYLAAENGDARIAIRTNVNDAPGPYRVVFRDRASGLTAEREVAK